PFAFWIVLRKRTAIESTGFTTITIFPSTRLKSPSSSWDRFWITSYSSPATTVPLSDGAKVSVPEDALSEIPPSSSTSLIKPIGSSLDDPAPLIRPYSRHTAYASTNNSRVYRSIHSGPSSSISLGTTAKAVSFNCVIVSSVNAVLTCPLISPNNLPQAYALSGSA